MEERALKKCKQLFEYQQLLILKDIYSKTSFLVQIKFITED